jgi:hypothetical protein
MREAIDRFLAGSGEAIEEAGILVLTVEPPANAVTAVAGVADLHALAYEAVPAALADHRPLLEEAVAWDAATFDAVAGTAVCVLTLSRVADSVAAGVVVTDLDAGLRLAVPTALARRTPLAPSETIPRGRTRLVAISRAALLGLAASVRAHAVAAALSIAYLLAEAAGAGEVTAAFFGPFADALFNGFTCVVADRDA